MPKWRAYSAAETSTIDRAKLAYFALSVFWRASVHTWTSDDGAEVRIEFGARYNEELRRYLIGATALPKKAALLVAACTDKASSRRSSCQAKMRKIKSGRSG